MHLLLAAAAPASGNPPDFGEGFYEELAALVILAGLFYWKAWPYLRKMMDRRRQTIADQLSAGEQARAQGEALVQSRRAALEAARGEAAGLVEQARASAERLVAEGERRAAHEHERLVAKAASDLELERARQRDELITELSSLVVAGAARLVVAELDEGRQRRLIDEAIAAAEAEVA